MKVRTPPFSFLNRGFPRSGKTLRIMCALFILILTGCGSEVGEFFDKDHVEIHSKDLLREVATVEPVPEINNPLPELYRQPPKVVSNGGATKIFYFSKHHTPNVLKTLIQQQLGVKKISENTATNQLILEVSNEEEAQAALDFLQEVDVPPIQIKVDCLISELFADTTMDYETSVDIGNILAVESESIRDVGDAIAEVIRLGGYTPLTNIDEPGKSFAVDNPTFPGASSRAAGRNKTGLKIGITSASQSFQAVIDLLISKGYLKILMNTSVRVLNGRKAQIETSDSVPIQKTVTSKGVDPYDITEYKDVVDMLEVTPSAYSDGSISLRTHAMISSSSTPQGVTQKTIFTKREITIDENRIQPGSSLVIGGIRKSEQLGIVRGAPFLKDIPILGILFSSKDEEASAKEIMFILTPSISDDGTEHKKIIEEIRLKHARPEVNRGIIETVTDPLGRGKYTEHIEAKINELEQKRIEAETEAAEAEERVETIRRLMTEAQKRLMDEKTEAEQAKTQAQTARSEAEKIMSEMEKAKAQLEKAQAEMAKAKAEADKARAEAEKAKKQAQKSKAEAEKARQEVEKTKDECPCPAEENGDAEKPDENAEANNAEEKPKEEQPQPEKDQSGQ